LKGHWVTSVAVVRDLLGKRIDPHVRVGIDRDANWLTDAGYGVVDAEPPHIAEVTAAWFDVMGADFAGVWPLTPAAAEVVCRFLAAGVIKFVGQQDQAAASGRP
jgi:hypothetical protein